MSIEITSTAPVEAKEVVEATHEEVKVEPVQPVDPVPEKKDPPPKFVQTIQLSADVSVDDALKNPNQALVDRLFTLLAERVNKVPLTHTNIVELVGITIQLVQKLKRGKEFLTNEEKKSIAMHLIRRVVKETPMDDELRVYLDSVFIPLMLSGVIDSLCSLDVHEVRRSMFPCC